MRYDMEYTMHRVGATHIRIHRIYINAGCSIRQLHSTQMHVAHVFTHTNEENTEEKPYLPIIAIA